MERLESGHVTQPKCGDPRRPRVVADHVVGHRQRLFVSYTHFEKRALRDGASASISLANFRRRDAASAAIRYGSGMFTPKLCEDDGANENEAGDKANDTSHQPDEES